MKWRAFPLHPDTPPEGMTLEELFKKKGTPVDVDQVMAKLKSVAESLNLELGNREMTYNSRLAQEAGLWAETKGRADQFHMAAFKAYFAQGKNIGKKEILLDLMEQSGLDTAEGEAILDERRFSDAVDADWERSRCLGIQAVPTFIFGFQRLVGAQPYSKLEQLVGF